MKPTSYNEQLLLRLPEGTKQRLVNAAKDEQTTVSELVRMAIKKTLARHNRTGKR